MKNTQFMRKPAWEAGLVEPAGGDTRAVPPATAGASNNSYLLLVSPLSSSGGS